MGTYWTLFWTAVVFGMSSTLNAVNRNLFAYLNMVNLVKMVCICWMLKSRRSIGFRLWVHYSLGTVNEVKWVPVENSGISELCILCGVCAKDGVSYANISCALYWNLARLQGCIRGHLLFILFVNNICSVSNRFYRILYADDTTLISTFCVFDPITGNNDDRSVAVNRDFGIIKTWLEANKLSLNATKTKYMVFHSIDFPEDSLSVLNLRLNNVPIERVKQKFDFLCLTIFDTLTWKDHINKIANKIAKSIGVMSRLKYQLDKTTLVLIYNSLVLPHF